MAALGQKRTLFTALAQTFGTMMSLSSLIWIARPITQMTENYIRFEGSDAGTSFSGGIDRVSGSGFVQMYRGPQLMLTDYLSCRSAKPLF
jgi:hypothetical protein